VDRPDIFAEDPKTEKRELVNVNRPGIYVEDPEVEKREPLDVYRLSIYVEEAKIGYVSAEKSPPWCSEDLETLKAQSEKVLITPLS